MKKIVILSIFSLLFIWSILTMYNIVPSKLFPTPIEVILAYKELILSGKFQKHLFVSLFRIIARLTIGTFLGIIVGLATGINIHVDDFFGTLINILRPVPVVAVVPFIIIWLGIGEFSKIFLIGWVVFSIVWIQTHLGVKNIDKSYHWLAQSLYIKKIHKIRHVVLPAIIPSIIAALRIAIPTAYIILVVAELTGTTAELGHLIFTSHLAFRLDQMLVGIITLGVCGALSDTLFFMVVRRYVRWYRYDEGTKI